MKFLLTIIVSLISLLNGQAQPDYTAWNQLLNKYVSSSGNVNYTSLKKDEAGLVKITDQFSKTKVSSSWNQNDQLAFWINAYNAFTLKLIIDNFPLKSIQNLDGGKTWDVKRITIDGAKYSLNQIENEIIRAKFNDARIHFAVNCGAKSCPPLLNAAFIGKTLDKQLDAQSRSFINNSTYNSISKTNVKISKIFDWYKSDFKNIIDFVNGYSSTKVNGNATIRFQDYDWSLNGK